MSQDSKQNPPRSSTRKKNQTEDKMEEHGGGRPLTPDHTQSELASIKCLLQGVAADVSSMKTGLDLLQTTVEKLGTRLAEAEARISNLEDASNSRGATIDSATSNIKKLQDKVTYLEDAGRRNNVRVTGVPENAEKQDLHDFMLTILAEKLDLDVDAGFELERAHRVGPRRDDGRSRHIRTRFLRFSAREAVLRAAREKRRVEWQGNRISFFQDLSQDVLQQRRRFDTVKKQLQERRISYSMMYPATLKVINNRFHTFTSPDTAADFLAAQD